MKWIKKGKGKTKRILKHNKREITIENKDDYDYILEWVKRSYMKNLKSFFEFVFRDHSKEELKIFREEPLKTSWKKLTNEEQVYLTYVLAELFLERLDISKHFPEFP